MHSQNSSSLIGRRSNYLNKCQYSVFENQRIQAALQQITRQSKTVHRSFNVRSTEKQNIAKNNETFRKFVKSRRCFRKTSKERQNFVVLKQDMQEIVWKLQEKSHQIQLNQFYHLKQKVLLRFLNIYVDDVTKQNLDKAELLVLVWNNLLLLVQKTLQKFCENQKIKQNNNLIEQTQTHKIYQNFLSLSIKQKQEVKQQNQKKQKFMKILVAKLREYKKQVKKMEDNLRIAAEKLNQFRRGYLQIQIQCINLTMELKNLSQQSAKGMIQRKMALALQKTKQYKILPSKKKMKKQLKAQAINSDSIQNIKVKQEFYEAFKGNKNQKPQNLPKIVGRLIQTILDKEQSQPINYAIFNQNLVEDKFFKQDEKTDKSTDMQGFFIDKADKKMCVNAQERFYYGMTKMRGVQTQSIQKPPPIKTDNFILQCDFKQLKSHKLSLKRTIDLSFLFENTLKSSNAKGKQIFLQKSIKQIPHQKSRKRLIQRDSQLAYPFKFSQVLSQNSNQDSDYDKSTQIQNQYNINIITEDSNRLQSQQTNKVLDSNGRRRIKKLASTFTNKVSFFNNFGKEFQKRFSKIQSNDNSQNGEDALILKEIIQQEILSIEERSSAEQNKSLNKNSSSIKKIKSDFNHQTNKKIKKDDKKKSQSNENKISKSLQKNNSKFANKNEQSLIVYKSIQRNKLQRLTHQNLINNIGKERKKSNIFTNSIKKDFQINYSEFYRQLCEQIGRSKQISITIDKSSSKIKSIIKTIESVFQVVFKDYFHTFKIKKILHYLHQTINNSYGLTNGTYLHKKVINFIKQMFQYRNESKIICSFLMMIQIDEKGEHITEYSNKNNQTIIKLMKKICIGWKSSFKLQDLKVNVDKVWQNIRQTLIENGFSGSIVYEIIKNTEQFYVMSNLPKGQDLFWLLLIINRYICNKQNTIMVSYQPILNLISQFQQDCISKQFAQFIVDLHFLNMQQKCQILTQIDELYQDGAEKRIGRAQFAYFCFQKQINDFSRLYYRGLATFQLKQNEDIIKDVSVTYITKINPQLEKTSILSKILKQCQTINQNNALFHAMIKKNLLILLYLKSKEDACENLLRNIIGQNLYLLYGKSSMNHKRQF